MRYKEDNNNRYRVNFMRATEELMDALTVESFISYLEENAEFEDYTVEYLKRVYPDKLITHRGRYTGGLEWVE